MGVWNIWELLIPEGGKTEIKEVESGKTLEIVRGEPAKTPLLPTPTEWASKVDFHISIIKIDNTTKLGTSPSGLEHRVMTKS